MKKHWLTGTLYLLLALVLVTGCGRTPPTLDEAQSKMDAGEFTAAADMLEQIVAQDQENAEAYFLLGLSYFNLANYEKAQGAFEQTLKLDPERAAAVHHNLGALAYQTGDMNTAIEEFKSALDADPNDSDTHYQLGATYLVLALPTEIQPPDEEKLQQAQAEFEASLALTPGKPEALVGIGNIYLLQNRLPEAIETLEQVVEDNPQMREALFALGRTYATAGDVPQAQATLQRFLDTDPPAVWAQQAQEILTQLGE